MSNSHSETQTIEYEHSIQLNLIESLIKMAQGAPSHAAAEEILDQFESFSEAHFLAEQLLMLSDGDLDGLLDGTHQLKDKLLSHMEASDRLLGAFLRESSEHSIR